MTWKEFKKQVEDFGIIDSNEIGYIDIESFTNKLSIDIVSNLFSIQEKFD